MKHRLLLVAAAMAVIVVTAFGSTGAVAGTKDQKGTDSAPCIDQTTGLQEGTFYYNGVTVAWPPNHKYRQATIKLVDEDDEPLTDEVTIATTGTHDQIAENGKEFVGSGNTDLLFDVTPGGGAGSGEAVATFFFRGERSGTEQDGRTYTFTATGTTDDMMSTCEPVEFEAFVPHDQGN
jgi:hypothetical protein